MITCLNVDSRLLEVRNIHKWVESWLIICLSLDRNGFIGPIVEQLSQFQEYFSIFMNATNLRAGESKIYRFLTNIVKTQSLLSTSL